MDQIRDVRAKPDRKAGRIVKGQTWDRAARKDSGPTWVTRNSLANKVSAAMEKGVLLSRENPIRDVRRKGRMYLASRIWSLILKKKEEGKADLISLHLTGRE